MLYRIAAVAVLAAGLLVREGQAGERVESHEFWVGANSSLILDAYRGSIAVEESPNPRISVEVQMEAPGEDQPDVDRRLQRTQVGMSQAGSTIKVAITEPKHSKIHFDWKEDGRLDLAITLKVPRNCAVDVTTTDGGITVGNVSGAIKARARVGTIFMRHIDGSVDAVTKTGSIIVSRCSGAVSAAVTQGDIQVGRVGGVAKLRTDSGEVEIQQAAGGVEAYAEAGGIAAGFPKGFTGDVNLRTNGGPITAKFDLSARGTIEASSVWGDVRSSLPLIITSGGNNKSKLGATLNGGGPPVTIHASGGHVRLLPGNFIDEP